MQKSGSNVRCPPRTDRPGTGRTAAALRATRSAGGFREVQVKIDGGKLLRTLSNDADAPAQRLPTATSAAGRSTCFSAMSSRPLKIRHFLGTGGNAVRIQIAGALCREMPLRPHTTIAELWIKSWHDVTVGMMHHLNEPKR